MRDGVNFMHRRSHLPGRRPPWHLQPPDQWGRL